MCEDLHVYDRHVYSYVRTCVGDLELNHTVCQLHIHSYIHVCACVGVCV